MKNLFRTFCIVTFTMFSLSTYSQSIGIKAGLNISNMKFDWVDQTTSETFKSYFGFHVGITGEFGNKLSFAPAVLLSTKGAKVDSEFGEQTTLLYLDIPLNLKYTHDMGSAKIFGLVGPYIGIGLSGTYEFDGAEEDISFGDGTDDWYKRTDIGLGFGGGLEFNKVCVGITYSLSLIDAASPDFGAVIKHRVLAISLGYKLTN